MDKTSERQPLLHANGERGYMAIDTTSDEVTDQSRGQIQDDVLMIKVGYSRNNTNVLILNNRIKRIHHWCSVGTGKSQPEGQQFQWETRLRRVSHWNGGPEGWDFPVPLYTNDRFYFSHI